MAGTSLTSGFDVVIQINTRNFEGFVEQRLAPLLSLLGSLPLDDPSTGASIGSLTFTGPPSVRFFLSATRGMQFEFELVLSSAVYALNGQPQISVGSGRSTLALPATIIRDPVTASASVSIAVEFALSSASFVPFDNSGLASAGIRASAVASQIAAALRRLLRGNQVVIASGIPLVIDGRADPVGPLFMRDLQPGIVRAAPRSRNVDVFAFGLSFLLGMTGNINRVRSTTTPLDEGTIAISNALVFNRVITSLSQNPPLGLGIPVTAFIVTPSGAPDTLAIDPGTRISVGGNELIITNFTLVASANALMLNSHFRFTAPPGVDFDVDVNGPVNFALTRGGTLVVGAVLTNSVTYRISVVGGVIISLAAALAALVSVISLGTAAVPVAAIGAATVAAAVGFTIALVDWLVGEIGRLLGPTFQTSIEAAFSGAGSGGVVPPGLLSLLGGSVSFTPPLIFDDFSVGASFPGISAVPELRRVDAVLVPPGMGIDIDSNSVVPTRPDEATPGLDLLWAAEGYPILLAQTGAKLRRLTGGFDGVSESQLERFVVGTSESIDGTAIPVVPVTEAIPDPLVIGVLTNERRYAKVAVWKDRLGRLILRYVIYDNVAPSLRIQRTSPLWQVILSVRTADTPGTWTTSPRRNYRVSNRGDFWAVCQRAVSPISLSWSLGGFSINGTGTVTVNGSSVTFVVRENSCTLTTELGVDLDGQLVCTARDSADNELIDSVHLIARGIQSVPYGRSGLVSRLDALDQVVVTRIEDIRPDPPPEQLIRVARDRIEILSHTTDTLRVPAASTALSLADATASLRQAISEPNLRDLQLR